MSLEAHIGSTTKEPKNGWDKDTEGPFSWVLQNEDLFLYLCGHLPANVRWLLRLSRISKKTTALIETPRLWTTLVRQHFFSPGQEKLSDLLCSFPGGPKAHFKEFFKGIHKNSNLGLLATAPRKESPGVGYSGRRSEAYQTAEDALSSLPSICLAYLCCLGRSAVTRAYAVDYFFHSGTPTTTDSSLVIGVACYVIEHDDAYFSQLSGCCGGSSEVRSYIYAAVMRFFRAPEYEKMREKVDDLVLIHGSEYLRNSIRRNRALSDLTSEVGHEVIRELVAADTWNSLSDLLRYESDSDVPIFLEQMKKVLETGERTKAGNFLDSLWPHPKFLPMLLQLHEKLRNNYALFPNFSGIYTSLARYEDPEAKNAISEFITFSADITGESWSLGKTTPAIELAARLVSDNVEKSFFLWDRTEYAQNKKVMEIMFEQFGDHISEKLKTSLGVLNDWSHTDFSIPNFLLKKLEEPLRTDWAVRFFANTKNNCHTCSQYLGWLDKHFEDMSPFLPHLRMLSVDPNTLYIANPVKEFMERKNIG
jgi:hypothetical protein